MSLELSWFGHDRYTQRSNYFGYYNAIHQTRAALTRLGVRFTAKSNVCINHIAPHSYEPFPGKFNVAITMYESEDIIEEAAERVRKADLIIVPSQFCKRAFQKWTGKPVEVVPLGVDHVPFIERTVSKDKDDPFVFLWVGAFNARKGWFALTAAWDAFFAKFPFCQLYIKTTTFNKDAEKKFTRGNAVIDARNISNEEMAELYKKAHVFVLPTMGEGWGMTVAEAMSSGCPTITTEYSGVLEFANRRNCFFAPHKLERIKANMGGDSRAPDGKFLFAVTDIPKLAMTMANVMNTYENSLLVGKRAAKDMQQFTWDRTAKELVEILRKI